MRLLIWCFSILVAAAALAACSGDDDGSQPDGGPCEAPGRIAVGSKPWAVAIDEPNQRLYSADEFDNTVTVVNLCTHEEIATLPSGVGPNSISVNSETGTVFVSNFNSNDVTVVENDEVSRTIPVGQAPWAVLADEDAGVAYVANSQSGTVSVIDSSQDEPLDTISGLAEPRGLARVDRTLYVAEAAANRVRAIDLDTKTFLGDAAVGQRPQGLAIDTEASELWVTNVDDATVSVVDLETMTVTATVSVGLSPLQVAVDASGHRAYTADSFGDSITVIDADSHSVINTFQGVQRPWDVELSAAGLLVYVANSATSEIIALDLDTLEP